MEKRVITSPGTIVVKYPLPKVKLSEESERMLKEIRARQLRWLRAQLERKPKPE